MLQLLMQSLASVSAVSQPFELSTRQCSTTLLCRARQSSGSSVQHWHLGGSYMAVPALWGSAQVEAYSLRVATGVLSEGALTGESQRGC